MASKLSPGAPSWVPISIQSSPSLPQYDVRRPGAEDEVVALAGEDFASMSSPVTMKSLPVAADDQVEARGRRG